MAEFALDPTPRATVRKVLYRGNPGTSDTLLYTSPNLPGGRTEVSRIVVANTNDSAITFRLHAVPKGGSVGVTNALFYDVSVAANATVILRRVLLKVELGDLLHDVRGLVLEEGEMLRALQSAASKICLTITGVQEVRVGGVQ